MTTFDLVVVGTGSGLDVASWAVGEGWRVALVEKGPAGGTCLNRGCIPSKMLIHAADVARAIQTADAFGIHSKGFDVDFGALVQRVRGHVDGESARIAEALRAGDNPRYFEGEARFVGARRLVVGDEEIEARRVVLATGARPRVPNVPGLRDVPFMTSTEALAPDRLPESLVILGGGYVAAELGHFYGALGTRVTVVQRHGALLAKEDSEVSETFTREFTRDHEVLLHAEAVAARRAGNGAVEVDVASRRRGRLTLRAERLLVAVGTTPNSDTLHLAKAGVETDARGFIKADFALRTTAPGVWAFGDAVGRFAFKHAANHEAQYLMHNLGNPERLAEVDYHAMPHAVFSAPQVAAVGATEDELRAAGVRYAVARCAYKDSGMGKALGEPEGFVKFLVRPADRVILGCHVVGPDASTLIHEVLVGMRAGTNTLADFLRTVHVHPALSEIVQRAAASL